MPRTTMLSLWPAGDVVQVVARGAATGSDAGGTAIAYVTTPETRATARAPTTSAAPISRRGRRDAGRGDGSKAQVAAVGDGAPSAARRASTKPPLLAKRAPGRS